MTPDQERLVLSLVVVPGPHQPERASAEDILAAFGAADGPTLCRALLEAAVLERSPDDVDLTITLIDAFGWGRSSLRVLQRLARETPARALTGGGVEEARQRTTPERPEQATDRCYRLGVVRSRSTAMMPLAPRAPSETALL